MTVTLSPQSTKLLARLYERERVPREQVHTQMAGSLTRFGLARVDGKHLVLTPKGLDVVTQEGFLGGRSIRAEVGEVKPAIQPPPIQPPPKSDAKPRNGLAVVPRLGDFKYPERITEWLEAPPPKAKRTGTYMEPTALRERPGKWGRIAWFENRQTAHSMANRLRKRFLSYRFVSRREGEAHVVIGCYVQEKPR